MSAAKTLSTAAAMLLILYLVLAARVYAAVQKEQLRLRFQHGLAEGWKQAAQRFSEGSTDVWTDWTEWLKPPAWKAGQNPSLRPGPEPLELMPSSHSGPQFHDDPEPPAHSLWGRGLNTP